MKLKHLLNYVNGYKKMRVIDREAIHRQRF